jgi:hypothetical protein
MPASWPPFSPNVPKHVLVLCRPPEVTVQVACSIPACLPDRVRSSLVNTNWSPDEGGWFWPPSGGLSTKWKAISFSTRWIALTPEPFALTAAAAMAPAATATADENDDSFDRSLQIRSCEDYE